MPHLIDIKCSVSTVKGLRRRNRSRPEVLIVERIYINGPQNQRTGFLLSAWALPSTLMMQRDCRHPLPCILLHEAKEWSQNSLEKGSKWKQFSKPSLWSSHNGSDCGSHKDQPGCLQVGWSQKALRQAAGPTLFRLTWSIYSTNEIQRLPARKAGYRLVSLRVPFALGRFAQGRFAKLGNYIINSYL